MCERRKTVLFLLLGAATLSAQHTSHSAAPAEKPVMLLSSLGTYSHRIATSNPESQQFFDQGLRLLYGFNRYEALRSFRRAAELDPNAIKPLWGMSMALGPYINMDLGADVDLTQSCQALLKALEMARNGSAYERAYVESAASRCPAYDPDRYIEAMRRLQEQYPDDLDAATLYAESLMIPVRWRWWDRDGSPARGMTEAISVLEQVMRRYPDHPGANHLYIHAVEMSPSPERAIPSAQRLMGIMPAAGHMVHMPAHIWVILGDWETAAGVNERAAQVDREYFAKTGVQSGYLGYYLHNLHFVAYARSMQGRAADAIRAADLLAQESTPAIDAMPEMADVFTPYGIFARLRFSRWEEMLSVPQPHPKLLVSNALWHWGRALACAAKGDRTAASREADLFRTANSKIPAQWSWINSKAGDVVALADAVLQARLSPDEKTAAEHWRRAVTLQDQLRYDEPPAWYMPLRESLGGSLLRAGDAAGAESVFREGLQQSARNGRMLFGLMRALEAQSKTESAAFVRTEFERAWKHADVTARLEDL
jgi:tetratricopeptide (TPR) repeat protein